MSASAALTDLCETIALCVVGLVIARDALRARLREAGAGECRCCGRPRRWWPTVSPPSGDWGRVPADADVDMVALTLIGAGHLLFADADAEDAAPRTAEVRRVGVAVVAVGDRAAVRSWHDRAHA
ncbi:hypothetical protein ACFXPN_02125 [Streptomyces griseorubiginosus]|uniref:hypothetical protein n=1 Tax=Streptomyces griseorubiginosus TaxID=67304 RepID=UPI0036C571FD